MSRKNRPSMIAPAVAAVGLRGPVRRRWLTPAEAGANLRVLWSPSAHRRHSTTKRDRRIPKPHGLRSSRTATMAVALRKAGSGHTLTTRADREEPTGSRGWGGGELPELAAAGSKGRRGWLAPSLRIERGSLDKLAQTC